MEQHLEHSEKTNKRAAIIIGILGVLYCIGPVDAIPDEILVTGWIDDMVIGGGALLVATNLFFQNRIRNSAGLMDLTKWTIWILGGFLVAVLGIVGITIYNLFI